MGEAEAEQVLRSGRRDRVFVDDAQVLQERSGSVGSVPGNENEKREKRTWTRRSPPSGGTRRPARVREQVLRPPGGADERIGAGTDGRVSEESQAMKAGKDGQVRTEDDRVWLGGHRMGATREEERRGEEEGGRKEGRRKKERVKRKREEGEKERKRERRQEEI